MSKIICCLTLLLSAALYAAPELWWAAQPLENASYLKLRRPANASGQLALQTPRNYRSFAALLIRNPEKTTRYVIPRVSGDRAALPGISMHGAALIRSRTGDRYADILPRFTPGAALTLPGEETAQLFFEIRSAALPSGTSRVEIVLDDLQGGEVGRATLELTVTTLELPPKPSMDLMVWDCDLRRTTDTAAADRLAAALTEGGVNTFHVLTHPEMRFDRNGDLVGKPDFTQLDRLLTRLKPYHPQLLFRGCREFAEWGDASVHPSQRHAKKKTLPAVGGRLEYGTPAWNNALRNYLAALSEHLEQFGIGKKQWALYPYDEYIGWYFNDFARAVRSIDPEIMIFANSTHAESAKALQETVEKHVDILTPFVRDYYSPHQRAAFLSMRKPGKKLWSYFCPWGQLVYSPMRNYRLMGWYTFAWDLDGAGYWSATGLDGKDWSGDPWDDTDLQEANETTLYITAEQVIPSRRWMGVKAALNDHALFTAARQIADKSDASAAKTRELKELLDRQIPREAELARPEKMMQYLRQVIALTAGGEKK